MILTPFNDKNKNNFQGYPISFIPFFSFAVWFIKIYNIQFLNEKLELVFSSFGTFKKDFTIWEIY